MRFGFFSSGAITTVLMAMGSAHAGLFIAKGNNMVMSSFTPNAQESQWLYGLSRDVSAGVTFKRYIEHGDVRESVTLQGNRLVNRWMTPDSVGNLYVFANAGTSSTSRPPSMPSHLHPGAPSTPGSRDRGGSVIAAGIWADYETRQFYSRISSSRWLASHYGHTVTTAQLGVSPIKAEYEELAPWVVVQAEHKRGLSRVTQITPMVRLIYKSWWFELGGSTNRANRGDLYVNLMRNF